MVKYQNLTIFFFEKIIYFFGFFLVMSSRTSSSSNTRSVSAAVSNESVAGDSGVFEASRVLMPLNKESAQVQIALKYSKLESILSVTIERARNLTALCLPNRCQL